LTTAIRSTAERIIVVPGTDKLADKESLLADFTVWLPHQAVKNIFDSLVGRYTRKSSFRNRPPKHSGEYEECILVEPEISD